MIYIEYPKKSSKNLIEIVNQYNKLAAYTAPTQTCHILHENNEVEVKAI